VLSLLGNTKSLRPSVGLSGTYTADPGGRGSQQAARFLRLSVLPGRRVHLAWVFKTPLQKGCFTACLFPGAVWRSRVS
jgi:hypothetical protein